MYVCVGCVILIVFVFLERVVAFGGLVSNASVTFDARTLTPDVPSFFNSRNLQRKHQRRQLALELLPIPCSPKPKSCTSRRPAGSSTAIEGLHTLGSDTCCGTFGAIMKHPSNNTENPQV